MHNAENSLDRDRFMKEGYVIVRGLFTSKEVASLQSHVADLPSVDGPIQTVERVQGVVVPNRTEAFAEYHQELNHFLRNGPLPRFVEKLAGEPISLYKEKAIYKAPRGSGGYTPHQDGYSSPQAGIENQNAPANTADIAWDDQFYVCMVAVDAFDKANGCPNVAPGFHTRGLFRHTLVGPPPYEFMSGRPDDTTCANVGEGDWLAATMQAGDVLIYNQYMPHTSAGYKSDRWRRALFGVYNAASRGELRTGYYEAGRAGGARWGYTQANPDGKGPRLTLGVDGTGEAVLEHPQASAPVQSMTPSNPTRHTCPGTDPSRCRRALQVQLSRRYPWLVKLYTAFRGSEASGAFSTGSSILPSRATLTATSLVLFGCCIAFPMAIRRLIARGRA